MSCSCPRLIAPAGIATLKCLCFNARDGVLSSLTC